MAYDRATGRGVVLNYDFSWNGRSSEGLPRDTPESVYARTSRQGFADHAPGEYQATVWRRRAAAFAARRFVRGGAGAIIRRTPANVRRPKCFSGCAGSIRRPMAR